MSFADGYILEVLKLEVKPEKEDHITPHERRKVEHLLFGSDKNVKGTFRAVLAPTVEEDHSTKRRDQTCYWRY